MALALGQHGLAAKRVEPGKPGRKERWLVRSAIALCGETWRRNMRDAAEMALAVVTARLRRELDESECKRRNALSRSRPGFVLRPGDVGTVLETLGDNEAFLVEFSKSNGASKDEECEWLGVLYPAEIEMVERQRSRDALSE